MNRATGKKFIILSFFIITFLQAPHVASEHGAAPWAQDKVFTAQPAMREVALTGYTRARHVMDIVSEESGRCAKVAADIGDTIDKSGVFAVLDKIFVNLAIEKNRVNQVRVENMLAYYAKDVRRYERLVGRETAAQSTLDELQNKLDQSEFELQALKIEETNLKERRARHLIRVPPGWTITERRVEEGEWVPVEKHLGKAGDFRTLLVPFSFSPEELRALKKLNGAPELRFPDEGNGGITLRASVERISRAFDPKTRKISVDLAVLKGLSHMRGGLRAELVLEIPDPSGAVVVPTSALSERYEEFWLTRAEGDQVRVALLGHGHQNTSRVRSPKIKAGNTFKVKPD